ncbi:putative disease resistance protein [Arabidopsis thaliana]
MQSFGVQQAIVDGGYMQPQGDRQREMRQTFSKDYESDFVGLEVNVKKLVGYLVEEDDIQIVSVTGMGGLGKTTLARQVFNHEDVKHQFDRLAWVCVSQEFTQKSVWQTILQNLTSKENKDEILKMKEAELHDELFQLLEASKSLIVFDDIWKDEDWDLIKPIFPPKKGWKVLLTSRNESVAVRGDIKYLNFKPECLAIEDSWTLFQRIAFPKKDASESKVDEEMEDMGKQMLKHCGGLPLAIKVLGGLLAAKYTMHDWERLSINIGSHIVGRTSSTNSSIYHVLSMSFEELPSYLKHCFLYLAHFPEDHKINVEKLSYCWAAEGISTAEDYHNAETIQDVGESYIEELMRRNMIIWERDATALRFGTCHLHDMMREVCLFKAKEENFLEIAVKSVGITSSSTGNSQSPCRSRRLVYQCPTTLHVERDINNPKLRSLVVLWHDLWVENWKLLGTSFTRLKLLRVLDLFYVDFEGMKLPSGIGNLIHLRYLSLQDAKVSRLPSSLGNLMLLIYLNLDVDTEYIFVPDVFMRMHELRYLKLPFYMHKKTRLSLRNLVKLETLVYFSTWHSSSKDLCGMTRLMTLAISLTRETSTETLSASISGLRNLEYLYIVGTHSKKMREEGIVLDFIHLKHLLLDLYMPRQQHFPSRLTFVKLSECGLEEDPMPILEKLLHLKGVILLKGSYCGRRMVCSGGGFPQLKKLEIVGLNKWEEWLVEEGSMPLLETLSILDCEELKEIPDGLRFIYSLELVMLGTRWKKKFSVGGEDYYKVQHIPSVEFIGGYFK